MQQNRLALEVQLCGPGYLISLGSCSISVLGVLKVFYSISNALDAACPVFCRNKYFPCLMLRQKNSVGFRDERRRRH